MSGTITCCKDCTKREVGCHSSCEEYNMQKSRREELKNIARQDSYNDAALHNLKRKFYCATHRKCK